MGKYQMWLGILAAQMACNPVLHVGESSEAGAAGQPSGGQQQATSATTGGAATATIAQGGNDPWGDKTVPSGGRAASTTSPSGGRTADTVPPNAAGLGILPYHVETWYGAAGTPANAGATAGTVLGTGGFIPGSGGSNTGGVANAGAAGFVTSSGGAYPTGTTGPDPLLVAAYRKALSGYAFGDFDHDSIVDLAVTATRESSGPSELVVHRGQGNGVYAAGVSYPTGTQTYDVVAADVNQDGILDLVVANRGAGQIGSVGVHLGLGNGDFAAEVAYPTGTFCGNLWVADLNGDRWPDLITLTGSSPANLGVMLGRGNGTFGSTMDYSYPIDGNFSDIAIDDLDGDGLPELIVATVKSSLDKVFEYDAWLTVLRNLGDSSFTRTSSFRIYEDRISILLSIVAGDLNGDHHQDLAAVNSGGTLSVLLGNGDGTFATQADYPASAYSSAIAIGDLNGDAAPDLVTLDVGAYTASVHINRGDGTFDERTDYAVGYAPRVISIGEYNGDGRLDIAVARLGNGFGEIGWVGILPGNGDGTLQLGSTSP